MFEIPNIHAVKVFCVERDFFFCSSSFGNVV
uniref:Uncharacterized protein n=1 Tax=Arundo donax TaxID=35708 RepID=A0A0A9E6Y0_ARUDO